MPSTLARLIVCEKSGRWAVALRGALPAGSPRVFETRSLPDCWDELIAHPASLVGLEVTPANLERVTAWLMRFGRTFPVSRAVLFVQHRLQSRAALLREAGAVHVLYSSRNMAPIARLVQRHFALVPEKPQTACEQIRNRLPWGS